MKDHRKQLNHRLERRNLTPFARAELALRLEPLLAKKAKTQQGRRTDLPHNCAESLTPMETRFEIAKAAGVSHGTVSQVKLILAEADEATTQQLRTSRDTSIRAVAKRLRESKQQHARAKKRHQAAQGVTLDARIIVGDFREHADKVADGSVSLIFTDPPYDRKASKMLPDLASFAAAKLAEGGSLLCYVGQTLCRKCNLEKSDKISTIGEQLCVAAS